MSGGPSAPGNIFEDVYEKMPQRLIEQREDLRALLGSELADQSPRASQPGRRLGDQRA